MMDRDTQLKLQAHLDGELSGSEARRIEQLLDADPHARALRDELQATRQLLTEHEVVAALAESRAFYWSKIEREIQRQRAASSRPQTTPILVRLRRFLVPAGAVAALMVAALLALLPSGPGAELESTAADSAAFTYRDYTSGTTLVWLSFPAEADFAEPDSFEEPP
jgi:anti-sigma factor RsiW